VCSWEFVGYGRKLFVYNHTDPVYTNYWRAEIDNTRRLYNEHLKSPNTAQQQQEPSSPRKPKPVELSGLPNVDLYETLSASSDDPEQAIVSLFVFGVPFRELALDDTIYQVARSRIKPPPEGSDWRMTWSTPTAEKSESRLYKALVLRFAYLASMIDMLRVRKQKTPSKRKRSDCVNMIRQAELWMDAHIMLAVALEELRYIPDDRSQEWSVLLERYKPDVNMMFHAGEMPDLMSEIRDTPFFGPAPSSQNGAREARSSNPVAVIFAKGPPRRCGVRDLVAIMGEYALRNLACFDFIISMLAFFFLGVGDDVSRRPELLMRMGVYRLFFFEMDKRLLASRKVVGGKKGSTRLSMREEYNVRKSDIHIPSTDGNPIVVFPEYEENLINQYEQVSERAAKSGALAAATESKARQAAQSKLSASATAELAAKANAIKAGANGKARARATAATGGSAKNASAKATGGAPGGRGKQAPITGLRATTTTGTDRSNPAPATSSSTPLKGDNAFRAAMALSRAYGRLEFERQAGFGYYEQRLASGTLPKMPAESTETLPPPPLDSESGLTDIYAYKNRLPCDEKPISAEERERRYLVFRWLSVAVETTNTRTQNTDSEKKSTRFVNKTPLMLALRTFMVYLIRRDQVLHNELCARVSKWASWETSINRRCDAFRAELSNATVAAHAGGMSRFMARGMFLRGHRAYAGFDIEPNAPSNNLYQPETLSFMIAFQKAMTAYRKTVEYLENRKVLKVMPRETPVVMRKLFDQMNYSRTQELQLPQKVQDLMADASLSQSGGDVSSTGIPEVVPHPYFEIISKPRPPYTILPTIEVPGDDWTREDLEQRMIKPGYFPLRLFGVSTETVHAINDTHMRYYEDGGDDKNFLTKFCESLAAFSVYEFEVVRAYCEIVNCYFGMYTFALPRYLVEHQQRALCNHHGFAEPKDIPANVHRSLLCRRCRRFAGFLVGPKGACSNESAIGTDCVRAVRQSTDDMVMERFLARGRLLGIDEIEGAKSMLAVLTKRAKFTPPTTVYDKYCHDPLDAVQRKKDEAIGFYKAVELDEKGKAMIAYPADIHKRVLDPETGKERSVYNEESGRRRQNLMDKLFDNAKRTEKDLRSTGKELDDPRNREPGNCIDRNGIFIPGITADQLRGEPLAPFNTVADEGTVQSEIKFRQQLRAMYSRMQGGLMIGHDLPTDANDRECLHVMACTCASRRLRAEQKKAKALASMRHKIAAAATPEDRARLQENYETKRCRDANTLEDELRCSTERLIEFNRHARGLVISQQGRSVKPTEFVLDCCGCGTSVYFSACQWSGDALVCHSCVSRKTNTLAETLHLTRKISMPVITRVAALPLAKRWRSTACTTLPDECIDLGEPCALPKCTRIKAASSPFVGRQVMCDTPGSERVGYVYFCGIHAKQYHSIIEAPYTLTSSAVGVMLLTNRTNVVGGDVRAKNYRDQYIMCSAELEDAQRRRIIEAKERKRAQAEQRRRAELSSVPDFGT
jgi:hypothetical protein